MNWRSPESDAIKMYFMREAWGDRIPNYVFYFFPEKLKQDLNLDLNLDISWDKFNQWISEILFAQREITFGDVELSISTKHSSRDLEDEGSGLLFLDDIPHIRHFSVLRLRRFTIQPLPVITFQGHQCHLVQYGHAEDSQVLGADGKTPLSMNFIKEWGWFDS